uniref:Ubiquitin carboxyl-terminal hydrolase n=1 Tax=Ciona savignyi TaxID=51511 RepID=H2ZMQ3_CIOSA
GPHSQDKLAEEKSKIKALADEELRKNDIWYLIDARWYKQWLKFVSSDDYGYVSRENLHPGPIDNSSLFTDDSYERLKDHLSEEIDYKLLPKEAWDQLVNTYGLVNEGSAIERKVIEQGSFFKKCSIEVYPMELKLCQYGDRTIVAKRNFSKGDTIADIEEDGRKLFEIATEEPIKLWNAYLPSSLEQLFKAKTVEDSALQPGQLIIFETKKDGKWTHQTSGANSQNGNHTSGSGYVLIFLCLNTFHTKTQSITIQKNKCFIMYTRNIGLRNSSPTNSRVTTQGLCGLNNLGNTCFMNSALQCLSNVPAMTNYFKSNTYKKELNKTNPLGMGGKLAQAYAQLIQSIWSGDQSSFAPREFKMKVSQFAPRFSGYQQHDSQELFSFLVDGLHEDLNRISKKPYIEMKEADGRPDDLVAQESWDNHRRRNDSIIVDTLHGLFRSKVDCPECPRISVTFDPFCFLSLPLPMKRQRTMDCWFVPVGFDDKICKYKVTVAKSGCIRDLFGAVTELQGVPETSTRMVATDVYNCRFHKIFKPREPITSIYEKDYIYLFEAPPNMAMLPAYMRHMSWYHKDKQHHTSTSAHLFGQPFLIPVNLTNTTYRELYKGVLGATWFVYFFFISYGFNERLCSLVTFNQSNNHNSPFFPHRRYINDSKMISEVRKFLLEDIDVDDVKDDDSFEVNLPCFFGGRGRIGYNKITFAEVFKLFTLKVVNSFGTQVIRQLENNDETLSLSVDTYIAVDWTKHAYDNYLERYNWGDIADSHSSVNSAGVKKPSTGVQLRDCMKLFTTEEKLDKDDAWYCSHCKKHQQATKKFDLWMLPPVLVIHLKRFSYTRYSRDKLDTLVHFPTRDLDLSDFIVNPQKTSWPKGQRCYNLIAVSNHYGGLGGGHYTAYAKNHIDKKWHYFDDSSVSLSAEDRVVTKAAYMLVYQRQD